MMKSDRIMLGRYAMVGLGIALGCVLLPSMAQAGALRLGAEKALVPASSSLRSQVEPSPEARLVFPADFFTASQPITAMDMLDRVPGFVFEGGDRVRGLSGSQGNVLIDGRRPASKSEDLSSVIRRIAASQVERIELIRGGSAGIDMQGLPVVANIIRRQGGAIEAAVSTRAERHEDGRWALDTSLEFSRSLAGDRRFEASGEVYSYVDDDAGDGIRERRDVSGGLVRASRADQTGGGEGARLTAGWLQPLAGGELSVNGLLSAERYDWSLEERRSLPTVGMARLDEVEDELELELGVNWARELGFGRLEVVLLQTLGDEDLESTAASDTGRETFLSDERTGESIGRLNLAKTFSPQLTLEAGLEGAFNWREGRASAQQDGLDIVLPSSEVRVEENRAEALVVASWRPSSRLSLEAGLRVETSRLGQTGQSRTVRELTFAKPRLNLVWIPDGLNQVRMRVEREVGQLDFGDFITSASLDTGVVSAGNAELMPPASWIVEAVYERRFWSDGALTLSVSHQAIEDAIDRIPVRTLSGIFDAPGNIGDAERQVAQIRLTLPLARLGLEGGLLKTDLEWIHTEATDPTTGEQRAMSGFSPFDADFEFTHDLPQHRMKWGISAYFGSEERDFRFDQISRERSQPWWSAFAEWQARPELVVKLEVQNITGRARRFERVIYDGPRDTAAIGLNELRRQSFGPYLALRVRRAFG